MRRGIGREMGSAAVGAAPPVCCVPGRAAAARPPPSLLAARAPAKALAGSSGRPRPGPAAAAPAVPLSRPPPPLSRWGPCPRSHRERRGRRSPGAELQRGQCLAEKILVNALNCVLGQASGVAAWLAARLIENNKAVLFLLVAVSFCLCQGTVSAALC